MSGIEVVIVIGLIAAAAAAVIFLAPKAKGVGAERQDLEISDSAYGNFIPLARGRVRLTGDLVYARDLIVEEESTGGGKAGAGGGAPSQKSFNYFMDGIYIMADASIFGPAKEIVKIWADTELIYDVTGEQELDVKDDVVLRFKLGDAVQEPDIMQVEDEGSLAQGFPFSVLIALDRFPLKYTGDRPPSLSAEIDFEFIDPALLAFEKRGPDTGTDYPNDDSYIIDYNAGKIYSMGSGGGPWTFMLEYDIDTLEEVDQHDLSILPLLFGFGQAMEFRGIDQDTGYLYGWHGYNPDDAESFNVRAYVYDPATKTLKTDVNFREAQFLQSPTDFNVQHYPLITSPNGVHKAVASTDFDSDQTDRNTLLNFPDLTFLHRFIGPEEGVEDGSPPRSKWMTGSTNSHQDQSKLWVCWVSFDNIRFYSYEITNFNTIVTTAYTDISRTLFHATKVFSKLNNSWCPYVDPLDDTVVVNVPMGDAGGGGGISIVFKWDPDTDSVLWQTETPFKETTANSRINTRLDGDWLVLYGDTFDSVYLINLVDGTFTEELDSFGFSLNLQSVSWDGRTNRVYSVNGNIGFTFDPYQTYRIVKTNIGDVALKDIIREICVRVGLVEGTDFDVDAVTGSVWGWKLTNRTKANEALGEVMQPFFLQAGTQDGLIKFITRNETSIDTIEVGEFIQDTDDEESLPYAITEEDEASLPSEVNIGYDDHLRDYESGNASYRRPTFPDQPLQSFEKLDMSTPFALTALQAKDVAYKWTYIPWLERDTIKGRLDWTHISYVGNDIVTFDFGSGNLKKARIRKASIRKDWTIDIEATFIELGASVAATFGASAGDFDRISSIEPAPDTVLHILDINLLRDQDDLLQLASLGYVAVGPKNPPNGAWFGAAVFRSYDSLDYQQISDTPFSDLVGITNEIFTTPDDPFGTKFDDTLDVKIDSGKGTELSNISYQALLNSGNPFIIIKEDRHEICQFQNVTNLGGNIFRLSILERGQRGTDTQVGGNALGDLVIFPTTANIDRFTMLLTNIGDTAFFRGVSSGQQFNDVSNQTKIMTGNDLKPYAPFHFVAFREGNDDLTITFNRRTRAGAGIVNGEWRSPLNEAISSFEVDLYDATGVTINRTLASATESFTYLAADQTTDGLSLTATTLWQAIYQLSDIVGRGYFYKLETPVT